MEAEGGTGALRAAAPDWSLAGDRQLLALLQDIHKKIMTRCEDTSQRLDEMVTALETAGVTLQNVNNRFMSLSNSQFIESRVYDDDSEVAADVAQDKKASPPTPAAAPSPLAGLLTLERLHEPVPICDDSDSDSGSDRPTSVILKPRDPYAARPLPHIIGSHGWKTKWHAGLLVEDSDGDSSAASDGRCPSASPSRRSDTDSEAEQGQAFEAHRHRESSSSSSERAVSRPGGLSSQSAQPTQADIAAELARRLGGGVEPLQPESSAYDAEETDSPVQRKIYKPQQPTAAMIFPDEPPPLAAAPSQQSDDDYAESDDDIFAEINKKAPYSAANKVQNADIFADLHGDDEFGRREPSPFGNKVQSRKEHLDGGTKEIETFGGKDRAQSALVSELEAKVGARKAVSDKKGDAKKKEPLFGEAEDSDLFVKRPDRLGSGDNEIACVKKPAGGVSIFGSNSGAARIVAAILNRNRKSSSGDSTDDESSGDKRSSRAGIRHVSQRIDDSKSGVNRGDSRVDSGKRQPSVNKEINKDSEKSSETVKDSNNDVKEKEVVDIARKTEKDIFDDLFDKFPKKGDAAPNLKKTEVKKVDLFSDDIFDDIDDIFSSKVIIKKTTKNEKTKSIFDDDVDDGLFAKVDSAVKDNMNSGGELFENSMISDDRGLFDSDDDLFSEKKSAHRAVTNIIKNDANASMFDSGDELFSGTKPEPKVAITDFNVRTNIPAKPKVSKSLFDDEDSEDDDMFRNIKSTSKIDVIPTESAKTSSQNELINVEGPVDSKTHIHNEMATQELSADIDPSKMQTSTDSFNSDATKRSEDILVKSAETQHKLLETPSNFDGGNAGVNLFTKINEPMKDNAEIDISYIVKEVSTGQEIKDVQVNKTIEVIKKQSCSNSPSIFDSDSDDDIFSKTQVKPKTIEGLNVKKEKPQIDHNFKPVVDHTETKITEQIKKPLIHSVDNAKKHLDNNKNIEHKGTLFTEPEETKTSQQLGIFDDIYAEPPVFEKPKEPKRSKNVNALFDDDSDDESLFFKKDGLISDEKTEDFPVANEEKTFTMFHDEPPAIDLDFDDNMGDRHGRLDVTSNNSVREIETIRVDNKPANYTDSMDSNLSEYSTKVAQVPTRDPDGIDGSTQSKKDSPKPIGKLKPMQININVNTLLPGASPKKVVKVPSGPESQPKHEHETLNSIIKDETPYDESTASKITVTSKLVKSTSFEETPESPVLDNKVSKDRAKIQVKRRPSTRRARKEAARKSAIDLFDGPGENHDSDETNKNVEIGKGSVETDQNFVEKDVHTADAKEGAVLEGHDKKDGNEITNVESSSSGTDVVSRDDSALTRHLDLSGEKVITSNVHNQLDKTRNVNPMVVEKHKSPVESDDFEDLFKRKVMDMAEKATSKAEKLVISSDAPDKTQVLPINDTDVYIVKDTQVKPSGVGSKTEITTENYTKELQAETEVQYIGRVYKRTDDQKEHPSQKHTTTVGESTKSETQTKPAKKPSLFDDLSDDDELFGGSTISWKSNQKNVFSETDSADSLFATTSSLKKDTLKTVGAKQPLFGDFDDDDDGLFGAKRKTSREEPQSVVSKAAATDVTTAAPEFRDPLSMFSDDEDDV